MVSAAEAPANRCTIAETTRVQVAGGRNAHAVPLFCLLLFFDGGQLSIVAVAVVVVVVVVEHKQTVVFVGQARSEGRFDERRGSMLLLMLLLLLNISCLMAVVV